MPELVAIHQPNFFPWLGFFDKLARARTMVLLDSVQFPKKGGTPINRVRLLVNGKPTWATAPVVRSYKGTRSIIDMRIDESKPWRGKLLKTIQAAYGQAPAYGEVFDRIAELVGNPSSALAEYNVAAITALASDLGLDSRLVRASDLDVDGAATDLLVAITRAVDGDAYLAGGGAAGYQEDEKFGGAGIEPVSQDFRHPVYGQSGEPFTPGLSVIDALMACGFEGVRDLLAGRT